MAVLTEKPFQILETRVSGGGGDGSLLNERNDSSSVRRLQFEEQEATAHAVQQSD